MKTIQRWWIGVKVRFLLKTKWGRNRLAKYMANAIKTAAANEVAKNL
jgi:uncharacterized protein (DUF2132 family)